MSAGAPRFVALVGSPNSGKTTLYNWLTNSKYKTVNYPGATVEYAFGSSRESLGEPRLTMLDTPGTYSLFPRSGDEEVTYRALYNLGGVGTVEKVIVVIDGTQAERHLVLATQLKNSGFSIVLVVTMIDLLQKTGADLDLSKLETLFGAPAIAFDGLSGVGLPEIMRAVRDLPVLTPAEVPAWPEERLKTVTKQVQGWTTQIYKNKRALGQIYDRTAQMDRFLLGPVLGLPLFFIVMALLFSSIFWLAQPFMDLIDAGFTGAVGMIAAAAPHSLVADFLGRGLLGSFGAVAVFAPQIFILFIGIGILESSGYLARAATLIDRPFSKIGLSGRSFVPILSGFACAVPAMMATRNISNKRDRLITNFVIPLMTCSARLPVYTLLLSFLFQGRPAWEAGLALAALYFFSLIVGAVAAGILNRLLPKNETSFFMMELPLYRKPQWRTLLHQSFQRMRGYLVKAGPVIFVFSVLIWVGTTFPAWSVESKSSRLEHSYLAQAGQWAEPLFRPMKVDWRVGVGLMSAFAAREVFVSSMALVFHATDTEGEGLIQALRAAKLPSGAPLLTVGSVTGLILFFMIALQCMSTFAVSAKENGSWIVPISQLVLFNLVGYGMAVLAAQVLG